jgi:serine/threonine-protein kinase
MSIAVENLPDRYVVEGLIGAGGMGSVYRAVDARLQRPVAIKVLKPHEDAAAATVAAALREARAVASIHHPNVAAMFDVVETERGAFLVMELVPGTTLRPLVGDMSVDVATRVQWLAGVAAGLAAAHDAGVIHRDIKPENVIVRNDGVAKILDFGIARLPVYVPPASSQDVPDELVTLSGGGGLVGTPSYMAPEQIRAEPTDARTDQFGWGAVAYELLTGTAPWKRTGAPMVVFMAILLDKPDPFAPALGIPDEIAAVVMRALSKRPDDRFDSMAEIVAVLAPFAAPISSQGFTPRSRVQPSITPPPPAPPESGARPVPPPVLVSPHVTAVSAGVVAGGRAGRGSLRAPDFTAPVDLQAHLDLLPPDATGKGMFFSRLLEIGAPARPALELFVLAGVRQRRYVAFGDYPMSDYLKLAVTVAREVHRGAPLGEALRRLGRSTPETMMASHIGRTLFGVLGLDAESVVLAAGKAYQIAANFGALTVERDGPDRFLLHARGLPFFLETFQVGAFEALLAYCKVRGRVRIATEGLADAIFELTW